VPVLVEILSIEWQLIFLGFGTLIGSFLATARTRRAPDVLLVPFVVVIVAILLVQLLYVIEPWVIGSLWLHVALKDAIGLVVIYCCMKNATRVRKK
jgi:predicted MFS family arabinose efflux permease